MKNQTKRLAAIGGIIALASGGVVMNNREKEAIFQCELSCDGAIYSKIINSKCTCIGKDGTYKPGEKNFRQQSPVYPDAK